MCWPAAFQGLPTHFVPPDNVDNRTRLVWLLPCVKMETVRGQDVVLSATDDAASERDCAGNQGKESGQTPVNKRAGDAVHPVVATSTRFTPESECHNSRVPLSTPTELAVRVFERIIGPRASRPSAGHRRCSNPPLISSRPGTGLSHDRRVYSLAKPGTQSTAGENGSN